MQVTQKELITLLKNNGNATKSGESPQTLHPIQEWVHTNLRANKKFRKISPNFSN